MSRVCSTYIKKEKKICYDKKIGWEGAEDM